MVRVRVEQQSLSMLWYLQKRAWYGAWVNVLDDDGNIISDTSWAGTSCSTGITGKADRWVFENLVDSNWRYSK